MIEGLVEGVTWSSECGLPGVAQTAAPKRGLASRVHFLTHTEASWKETPKITERREMSVLLMKACLHCNCCSRVRLIVIF